MVSEMRPVLLHTCCAPCATVCAERLLADGFTPTLFFSNANIAAEGEYERRLESVSRLAELLHLPLVVDREATHGAWLAAIRGREGDHEGGGRCHLCFRFNLGRTADYAVRHDIDLFTTTLTVSPHKESAALISIGAEVDSQRFLPCNFKKQGGFQRSIELAREWELYRQNYCGCEFSEAARIQREQRQGRVDADR